jgi:hypothetical protein
MSKENRKIRSEKKAMYNEVQENISGALYMLLADYKGMTMPETDEFKKLLRGANARVKVVKNSMLGRISTEMGCDIRNTLSGPTAVIFGEGDVVEVAGCQRRRAGRRCVVIERCGCSGRSSRQERASGEAGRHDCGSDEPDGRCSEPESLQSAVRAECRLREKRKGCVGYFN